MTSLKIYPSEHEEQAGFITWFRTQFPRELIFAIPNGEHRAISTAKRLKKEGVVAGIPDTFIPSWRVWVEMKKVKGGVLSQDQKDIIRYLESIGDTVIVGYGAEDASRKIVEHIKRNTRKGA